MQFDEFNNKEEFNSFLTWLTPEEIDLIIDDIKLAESGTQLIYIIDTYDIVQNYMPYIEMDLFSNRSINYQAQKHVCYDYFFNTFNPNNIVILDEYKIELLYTKDRLIRYLRDATILIGNIEELKKGTRDFLSTQNNAPEALFGKNFEIILVLLILNEKGKNILDNFVTFIRERLILSESQSKAIDNSGQIQEIILSSKPTNFSMDVFQTFVDNIPNNLNHIHDSRNRYIYLENSFRDIQVIERVISINKHLIDSGLNYRAIYLSSANKTK